MKNKIEVTGIVEQLAVVVYGVVAYATAGLLVYMEHSVAGMGTLFAGAAVTYLFQLLQVMLDDPDRTDPDTTKIDALLLALFLASLILPPVAVLVALLGD